MAVLLSKLAQQNVAPFNAVLLLMIDSADALEIGLAMFVKLEVAAFDLPIRVILPRHD